MMLVWCLSIAVLSAGASLPDKCEGEPAAMLQVSGGHKSQPELVAAEGGASLHWRRHRFGRHYAPRPPTPSPPPSPLRSFSYIIQAYCGDSWLTVCSDIPSGWEQHTGAFQADISTKPSATTLDSDASTNYIVFGGYLVDDGTIPSASTLTGWFSDLNADNVEFDMEGDAIQYTNWSYAAAQAVAIKAASSTAKIQMTGMVAYYNDAEYVYGNNSDLVDYFAILIHSEYMDTGGYSIPCANGGDPYSGETWKYIENWFSTSIPKSKMILAVTSFDLEACMVDWVKELISTYGLAGMSIWKYQNLTSDISLECIEDPSVNCSTSSDSSTTASACDDVCVGGDDDGQCCDPDSTTTTGSCATLGQEGCCGDSAGTGSYCQLTSCSAYCSSDSPVAGKCCDTSQSTSYGNCGTIGQEACCGDSEGTENWCQAT